MILLSIFLGFDSVKDNLGVFSYITAVVGAIINFAYDINWEGYWINLHYLAKINWNYK